MEQIQTNVPIFAGEMKELEGFRVSALGEGHSTFLEGEQNSLKKQESGDELSS